MVFQRWQKKSKNIKEILEVLKNRLDSSSYEDDMIEALNEIYKNCLKYPTETGDLCVESVLKSVPKTEDKHLQLQILQYLNCSSYSAILIDKITADHIYSDIFMNNDTLFFVQIIRSLNSPKINMFLSQNHLVTSILQNLINEGFHLEFRKFIESNQLLKETLIFEGLLEDLINDYKIHKSQGESKATLEIQQDIKILLDGSIKNQSYFVDNELYFPLIQKPSIADLEIISLIFQRENKNYKMYQKIMMDQYLILDSFNYQLYNLVYKIIDSNCETFKIFVEKYLKSKIPQLIRDCDESVDCFRILEMVIRNTHIEIKSEESFCINTLLFNIGLPHDNLDHFLVENLRNKTVNLLQLIYVVFTRDKIDDIQDMLKYTEYDEPLSSMCLFINLLHCKNIKLESLQIISRLKYLRLYILENEVTIDSLKEQLIETIGQLILQFTPTIERQSYEMKEDLSPVVTSEKIPEIKPSDSKSILIDEVNSKIKGLFEKFKRKDQDKSSYDL